MPVHWIQPGQTGQPQMSEFFKNISSEVELDNYGAENLSVKIMFSQFLTAGGLYDSYYSPTTIPTSVDVTIQFLYYGNPGWPGLYDNTGHLVIPVDNVTINSNTNDTTYDITGLLYDSSGNTINSNNRPIPLAFIVSFSSQSESITPEASVSSYNVGTLSPYFWRLESPSKDYEQFTGSTPIVTSFSNGESGGSTPHVNGITATINGQRTHDMYADYQPNYQSFKGGLNATFTLMIYDSVYGNWSYLYSNGSATNLIEQTFTNLTSSSGDQAFSHSGSVYDSNGNQLQPLSQDVSFQILLDPINTSDPPDLRINPDNTVGGYDGKLTCFYGFVQIMTQMGEKMIKDLKRGDLIETNDGFQPLARLLKIPILKNHNKDVIKIPKDYFKINTPNKDIYIMKTHPFSIGLKSEKDDKDYEYKHFFAHNLLELEGIESSIKNERFIYNLIFDKHYEINVGNLRPLSHHPNHNNGNYRLREGTEINKNNRSTKIYADKKGIYFDIITLEDIKKLKPSNKSLKEFIGELIQFS